MSYWIPVTFIYIAFFLGLALYFIPLNIRHYNKLRTVYLIAFFTAIILYMTWGLLRNFPL